jgi:hypothetical protein
VARRHHGRIARFLHGDVTRLAATTSIAPASFEAATFLLSIQDIEPLEGAIEWAAWALRARGRMVILMSHPCFRVPRQSGWGWDEKRALQFRRIDRYLTRLAVPMQQYGGGRPGSTRSYHRPLEAYVAALAANGLMIDGMCEIPGVGLEAGAGASSAKMAACREIPLFLGLRAVKQ